MQMSLLGFALTLGQFLERSKITWMSEAGAALIVGIVLGLIVALPNNLNYDYYSLFTFDVRPPRPLSPEVMWQAHLPCVCSHRPFGEQPRVLQCSHCSCANTLCRQPPVRPHPVVNHLWHSEHHFHDGSATLISALCALTNCVSDAGKRGVWRADGHVLPLLAAPDHLRCWLQLGRQAVRSRAAPLVLPC